MDGSEGPPRFPIISPLLPVSFPDFDPSSLLVDEQSCMPERYLSKLVARIFQRVVANERNEKE